MIAPSYMVSQKLGRFKMFTMTTNTTVINNAKAKAIANGDFLS